MWPALIPIFGQLLDKVLPDTEAANKAKAELISMQAKGELDVILAQIKVNEEEAKSTNPFVSGARPFILWTCGVAFGYAALVEPFARFAATVWFGYTGAFPEINTEITMQVLLGVLGLGGMRSFEKAKGVAAK